MSSFEMTTVLSPGSPRQRTRKQTIATQVQIKKQQWKRQSNWGHPPPNNNNKRTQNTYFCCKCEKHKNTSFFWKCQKRGKAWSEEKSATAQSSWSAFEMTVFCRICPVCVCNNTTINVENWLNKTTELQEIYHLCQNFCRLLQQNSVSQSGVNARLRFLGNEVRLWQQNGNK